MHRHHGAIAMLGLLAACGGGRAAPGIVTSIDSAADTIRVTIRGDVAATEVRQIRAVVRIAPGIDDTTLFTRVREFDVDGQGRFWVFDEGSQSILQFAPDGTLLRRIGREGAGPGEFRRNGGMVVLPGDGLAEWDSRNSRVSRFDSAGRYLDAVPVPGGFNTSDGLRLDASGQLYLVRPLTAPRPGEIFGRIGLVRLGADGSFRDSLLPPDLDVPRARYIARHYSSTMATSSRYAPSYLWTWLRQGAFVAADGASFRMVIAVPGRTPLVIHRVLSPVEVNPAERDEEEAQIRYEMRRTDPAWQWDGPPLPTEKAPLVGLVSDRAGRIWAQVAVPSIRLAEDELLPPRDSLDPVMRFGMPTVFEVFTATGELLGRVALPPRTRFVEAQGDTVWGLARDENDLPMVVRYRIEPALSGSS